MATIGCGAGDPDSQYADAERVEEHIGEPAPLRVQRHETPPRIGQGHTNMKDFGTVWECPLDYRSGSRENPLAGPAPRQQGRNTNPA